MVLNANVLRSALLFEPLKRAEDLLGTFAHGEAFENGVVGHGVDASPGLSEFDGHGSAPMLCQRTRLQFTGSQLLPQLADPAQPSGKVL